MRARRWVAALTAAAVLLSLAACAPFGSGRDRDAEIMAGIELAVEEAVPEANGAFVTSAFSGLRDRTLSVRLYIDPVDDSALADATDRAFAAAWAASPITPVSISFEAVAGQRPETPRRGAEQVIDLRPASDLLGLDRRFVTDRRITISESTLDERYGPASTEAV